MPTSYTSLLGLALPVTGELSGTWGDTVNDYITRYVDASVAGTQAISGSQTAVTLTVTNGTSLTQVGSGSSGSAQYAVINCTGNPAGLLTITAPASSRQYLIINATSTAQSVKIVGAGPTTGVTLVTGESAIVAWNGSDYVKVASSTADGVTTFSAGTTGFTPSTATSGAVTLAGTLATANGGTGLTSFTANGVVYASSTSALATGGSFVFDGSNLGLGVTPSAWGSGSKVIQINRSPSGSPTTVALGDVSNEGIFSRNAYNDGTWKYVLSDVATRYQQSSGGQHQWYTAPSGTAGNAISFTQAMTLDASGNLGVGVTPSAWASTWKAAQVGSISSLSQGSSAQTVLANNFYSDGTDSRYIATGAASFHQQFSGAHTWWNAASGSAGAVATFTQRLAITAAGFTQPVAYADTVVALGNTGTATTINLQTANVFTATLTGNCTFTLSNPIATGSSSFTLILTNDGTAGRTVAWSGGSFVFPGGASALSRTTTANAVDVWVFFTPNGGTTWYGNIAMKDMKA